MLQDICSTSYGIVHADNSFFINYQIKSGVHQQLSRKWTERKISKYRRRTRAVRLLSKAAEPLYPELNKIVEEKENLVSSQTPMKVVIRTVNTFDLWLWFEFYKPATMGDKDLLETVLESWFVLGRMGGFNSMNLQISQQAVGNVNFFAYDSEETETAMQALFMDYSEVEVKGKWCRFWVNMGTADEVALDILINALSVFSRENLGIKQLIIGGANSDWPVPKKDDQTLAGIDQPGL